MKKILFIATDDYHILNFHIPHLKQLKEDGYEIHIATNGDKEIPFCDQKHKIPFCRNPLKFDNLYALKKLKSILESINFEIIHCHNPIAGVITRMAAIKTRKNGTKVLYTAHGFHFYKGAPIFNWLIYYPIEKYFSKYTDCLITINQEDYELAKKKFKTKQIELVNGIGIQKEKFEKEFSESEKNELKNSLNIKSDKIVITYVAELNRNKNQIMLLEAAKRLHSQGYNLKILFVGMDSINGHYQKISKNLNMDDYVSFLGYRKDVSEILQISDIYVSTSKREGLGVNVLEAIYSRLPVIASKNRGHQEIIKDKKNGFLIKNSYELEEKIKLLIKEPKWQKEFLYNNKKMSEKFLLENVMKQLEKIYIKVRE